MIELKKQFILKRSQIAKKFRVENNNLDITSLIDATGHPVTRISEIAFAHREERKRKETAANSFKYVQISDIDVELGRIRSFRTFLGSTAPNNARRIMKEGDILVSTRRPTRGAVVSVPKDFDGDICTVFFTTLRVKDRKVVDPRYLALFLRTSFGRFQFSSLITETAYPVISDEDVEGMVVLLPKLDQQSAIADAYEAEVQTFFDRLNEAHLKISQAQQSIESNVLAENAEEVSTKRFGLVAEKTVPEDEEISEEAAED